MKLEQAFQKYVDFFFEDSPTKDVLSDARHAFLFGMIYERQSQSEGRNIPIPKDKVNFFEEN